MGRNRMMMQTTTKQTDNADDYAAKQTTFVNNVANYNADSDNAGNFADNGRQHK
jgi:hypothetical protein